MYIILAVAIATTALFYNHFEVNMHKSIRGNRSLLAWVHLIGMNIGGILDSGCIATQLNPNTEIMVQFILPISVFAAVLVIGTIAGGIVFITII